MSGKLDTAKRVRGQDDKWSLYKLGWGLYLVVL